MVTSFVHHAFNAISQATTDEDCYIGGLQPQLCTSLFSATVEPGIFQVSAHFSLSLCQIIKEKKKKKATMVTSIVHP